jgi:uncharacterized protein YbaR (Trm112 family)
MDQRLLDILCCPTTRQPLRLLNPEELAVLAREIDAGHVTTAVGRAVTDAPGGALITTNGRTIYRIEDDIPVLLADEAIAAVGISGLAR